MQHIVHHTKEKGNLEGDPRKGKERVSRSDEESLVLGFT